MIVKLIILLIFLAMAPTFLSGCASLSDGKFVTKEGKESPFNPMTDRYAPPKDPMSNY